MAYTTGTASTFADLKTAIENAAIAAGYTLSNGILSKNGCFFQLIADTLNNQPQLRLHSGTSQTGSTLNGQPVLDYGVKIASCGDNPISFPINYEIHSFTGPDELHCIMRYNSDFYQTLAFGKSDVPGIGGTGAWFTGTYRSSVELTGGSSTLRVCVVYWLVNQAGNGCVPYKGCGLPYFSNRSAQLGYEHSSFVHCGLDNEGWRVGYPPGKPEITNLVDGISYASSLLTSLPNISNQATILIPVKAIALRPNGGRTIVANIKTVRYCRIDNIVPGEVVTFGADRWKVYPFLRKDATMRDGADWPEGTTHSGTWGFAIKYTGS